MLGSTGSITSGLASVYGANMRQMYDALTRIASGKKFQGASEDLIGFIRSQNVQADISGYEKVRENLTNFKASTSAAVVAGSSVYENLSRMRELATQYAGTADADLQAEYAAEFSALKTQVTTTLENTYVDGVLVTDPTDAADIEVTLDPGGNGSIALDFTGMTASADVTILSISVGTAEADVQAELDLAMVYMYEAKSYDALADQQLNITNTILNSKKAVLSLITDIDEAEQMGKVLDLSLRQQATVAMMAQANMVQNSMAKLYE